MGRYSLIVALIVGCAAEAMAQGARHTPKALTEQVVATYKALNDPKIAKDQRQTPAKLAVLDQFFDYDTLSAAPFKSHQKVLKGQQYARVQATFRALLTHLTHNSGAQMGEGEVSIGEARAQGHTCMVDFEVSRPDDDVSSVVSLTWQQRPKGWQVVDVAFDGASVTKDYENQFGRILKKDGAKALENKLKERLAQVAQPKP